MGGAVILTIKDGKLGYRWTAGNFEGNVVNDLSYNSTEIADSMYLVNWHDPENKNYVSIIIDLNRMIEYGTALISYETQDGEILYDEARIANVKWLE